MKFYTIALCAALGVASQAQAAGLFSRSGNDERVKSGWVLGAGIGSHQHKETIQDETLFDTSSTSYKLFGGYRFNKYFSVEVAYVDGGAASETFYDLTDPVLSIDYEQHGFQGSALGSLPLGRSAFSLFGRVGYYDWKADVRITDFVALTTDRFSGDGQDIFFGGGILAALDGALLRLEYEYVDFDTDAADTGAKSTTASLSVAWVF
jgi:OmpA-OmpF porin, OOP family